MISEIQIHEWLEQLDRLQASFLEKEENESIIAKLNTLESMLALQELKHCLDSPEQDIRDKLLQWFKTRWERIRHSAMDYTQAPFHPVNKLCLEIAEALADEDDPSPAYFLLMPTLKAKEDIYFNEIDVYGLNEMVLSDDGSLFIPIQSCLEHAATFDGQFIQMASIDGEYPCLTESEIERLKQHSEEATNYYKAIQNYVHVLHSSDALLTRLINLQKALEGGGAHRAGTEFDAAAAANEGIVQFHAFWSEELSEAQRNWAYAQHSELRDLLGRLFRPADTQYQYTCYCVELIAKALESPICTLRNINKNIRNSKNRLETERKKFPRALDRKTYHPFKKVQAPNLAPSIFNEDELREQFQQDSLQTQLLSTWIQTIHSNPNHLIKFKPLLQESLKSIAKEALQENNYECCKTILKQGANEVVEMIFNDILESEDLIGLKDDRGNTPLIWAVRADNAVAVEKLLQWGADINEIGESGNSALLWALKEGHQDVADKLLEKGAEISMRNDHNETPLEIASRFCTQNSLTPQFLSILYALAKAPIETQREELTHLAKKNNLARNEYEDILDFIVEMVIGEPAAWQTVFKNLIDSHSQLLSENINKTYDVYPNGHWGVVYSQDAAYQKISVLTMMTRYGSLDQLRALLESDHEKAEFNKRDILRNTPLIWGANQGNADTVHYLLENYNEQVQVNAQGNLGNTALHWATYHNHIEAVSELVRYDANMTLRNHDGDNPLDLALKRHRESETVLTFLNKSVCFTLDEQRDFLSKQSISNGLQTESNRTAFNVLDFALHFCEPAIVQRVIQTLIENKSEILNDMDQLYDFRDVTQQTLVSIVAHYGTTEQLHTLLTENPGHTENLSEALIWATSDKKHDMVRLLLEKCPEVINLNTQDNQGTALAWAIFNNDPDTVKLLLEHGVGVTFLNNKGENSISLALIHHPGSDLPFLLLSNAVKLSCAEQRAFLEPANNLISYEYSDILDYAIKHFNTEQFQDLLERFIQDNHEILNDLNKEYFTPNHQTGNLEKRTLLDIVAERSTLEQFKWVIEQKGSINLQDSNGDTPLIRAVKTETPSRVVSRLIEYGADVSLRNQDNKTVFDCTKKKDSNDEIFKLVTTEIQKLSEVDQDAMIGNKYKNIATYLAFKKQSVPGEMPNNNLQVILDGLNQINFFENFNKLKSKSKEMRKKATQHRSYSEAASTAEEVVNKIIDNFTSTFIEQDNSCKTLAEKKQNFTKNCSTAISEARPILEKHRGWKKILDGLMRVLAFFCGNSKSRFFKVRTDSEKNLDNLDNSLKDEHSKSGPRY